jgi:hypothetical protein
VTEIKGYFKELNESADGKLSLKTVFLFLTKSLNRIEDQW